MRQFLKGLVLLPMVAFRLVNILARKALCRSGPFDQAPGRGFVMCREADDLDKLRSRW